MLPNRRHWCVVLAGAALLSSVLPGPSEAAISREPCLLKKDSTGEYFFECPVYRGEDEKPVTMATFHRPFKAKGEPLRLQDRAAAAGEAKNMHFHYYLSILGSIAPSDPIITDAGKDDTHDWPKDANRCTSAACSDGDKGCTDLKTAAAGGFQWDDRDGADCVRLTGTATEGADEKTNTYSGYSAYLVDEQDAAQGIMLHRSGGTKCGDKGPRKLNITLYCGTYPEEQGNFPSEDEFVYEDSVCTYEISMVTTFGCPDQCMSPSDIVGEKEAGLKTPVEVCNHRKDGGAHGICRTLNNGSPECACDDNFVGPGCTFACPGENTELGMCSNRGHCAYDSDVGKVGKAKCFCDSGFMGETCERNVPTNGDENDDVAPVSVILWVFTVILLVLLLVGWAYHRREMGEPFCCWGSGNGNSMAGFESV